ncbi:MAG: peptidoglycan editing factor PgeF [Bryobacteraceae bacterium]|jgi:YfiH family protein
MLRAPNLAVFDWLVHGFGLRESSYPVPITTVQQIHSGLVVEASEPASEPIAEADGIVTRRSGLLIGVRTADCVPILIADERTRAAASIHAGWRGTAYSIAIAGVNEMTARYGSRPEDLHAAIGPAIGPCCFEVGPDVAHRFAAWNPDLAETGQPAHIDLPAINEMQLRAAGVSDIWQARECTFCAPGRFFSFRREKEQAGRMLSFIGIAG